MTRVPGSTDAGLLDAGGRLRSRTTPQSIRDLVQCRPRLRADGACLAGVQAGRAKSLSCSQSHRRLIG